MPFHDLARGGCTKTQTPFLSRTAAKNHGGRRSEISVVLVATISHHDDFGKRATRINWSLGDFSKACQSDFTVNICVQSVTARCSQIETSMILVAGLTPAWQQIAVLDRLQTGGVNRAREVYWCASGKVLNVGLALTQLGASVQTLSLVGTGPAGEAMRRDMNAANMSVEWIECAAPQRVCTTLLDSESGATTEIVENFPAASTSELAEFANAFTRRSAAKDCELLVLTGSLPSGTSSEFVGQLLSVTSAPAILDLRGPELLAALRYRPWLVKPNRDELAITVGRTLTSDDDVWLAMRELKELGATWVVVTDGPRDVLILSRESDLAGQSTERRWRMTPPAVRVVNPIGCGDCFTAGLAWATQQGHDTLAAIRGGMVAAAVNAGQLLPARIDTHTLAAAMANDPLCTAAH